MPISSEEQAELLRKISDDMALIGTRLDRILAGFKLYHEFKGTLDIRVYESTLAVYEEGLKAMEEQLRNYRRIVGRMNSLIEEV